MRLAVVAAAFLAFAPTASAARLTLKSICRIKGQEENTLQGLGIVVGLKGTGDSANYLPTVRSVAKIMTLMRSTPGGTAGACIGHVRPEAAAGGPIALLEPGDIIFTGTPHGVILGYPKEKQVWLKAGDEIVSSIEKLGDLTFRLG